MVDIRVVGRSWNRWHTGIKAYHEVDKETNIVVHTVDDAVRQISDMVTEGLTTISMSHEQCKCTAYKNGEEWAIWWQPPYAEKKQVPEEDVAREMGEIFIKFLLD